VERDSAQPLPRRVVLYEFTCSGGLLGDAQGDLCSLTREGRAMLQALAEDLAAIPGVALQVLVDHRASLRPFPKCEQVAVQSPQQETSLLRKLARGADWTIVIAPETNGILLDRCRAVEECGGRLLGPPTRLIDLLGDKHRTAEYLSARGVSCPRGIVGDFIGNADEALLAGPLVVKPLDGAGAQYTYLVSQQRTLRNLLNELMERHGRKLRWRIESFCKGVAVSTSVICGATGCAVLPPCYQNVKCNGVFSYCGGSYPIEPLLAQRAMDLASRVVKALPHAVGYIGIDMVLGDDPDGRSDCVIEVNPRLTTSYVGLRCAVRGNLALAMFEIAEARMTNLSFAQDRLAFNADGYIHKVDTQIAPTQKPSTPQ
jgi:predicted ATP-grasp superfamily ATP-dependent carboligase